MFKYDENGKNVSLHHGELDWDFDKRVWDWTYIKSNIRVILTKVL